ncbi:hypothetical protein BDY19DRAFT_992190 [Irpex rosettiformis]|uniref:Uncharacterized protein n=1 Tax=Irpex rosettiformis TaxID=378272 RepID=A0ACB8U9C5_9APHY|nr:hypothetical protein BDY19DRAFT_992190 [Irpex rosettiformis]
MAKKSTNPPPTDEELLVQLNALHKQDSSLGVEKILKQLLTDNPQWVGKIGLKRIKQVRKDNGLVCTAPGAHGPSGTNISNSSTSTQPSYSPYGRVVQDTTLTELLTLQRELSSGQPLSRDRTEMMLNLFQRVNEIDVDADLVG